MFKKKEKFINSKQAVKLAKKFGVETTKKHILKNFKDGDQLFRRKNLETKIITDYFLCEIYFKKFSMNYSCHHNIKKGREIIISNMELPKGKVVGL